MHTHTLTHTHTHTHTYIQVHPCNHVHHCVFTTGPHAVSTNPKVKADKLAPSSEEIRQELQKLDR